MAKITDLPAANSIDATVDVFPIVTNSINTTQKISRNTFLGLSSAPLGTTDTQSPTNKTYDNTNAYTTKDGSFTLQNTASTTKQAKFSLASITAGQTRTFTLPDTSDTVVTLAATQTLTNKTLTSPTISAPSITNATISADTITGFSSATNVTVGNVTLNNGAVGGTTGTFSSLLTASSGFTVSSGTVTLQNGTVSSKALTNPYKFLVRRNAAFTTTGGAFTLIPYDTAVFDTGSNVDIVTNKGRFTAPVAGFYHFESMISFTTPGLDCIMALYKNGSIFNRGLHQSTVAGNNGGANMGITVQSAASDYWEMFIFATASAVAEVTAGQQSYFSGFLVSQT